MLAAKRLTGRERVVQPEAPDAHHERLARELERAPVVRRARGLHVERGHERVAVARGQRGHARARAARGAARRGAARQRRLSEKRGGPRGNELLSNSKALRSDLRS